MSNQATATGNDNIIIQDISDSTITLNVNGNTREILNELTALRNLMQELNSNSFLLGQKSYEVEELSDASFNLITAKRFFNEELTRKLIESLQPFSELSRKFLQKAEQESADWTAIKDIRDTAHIIIAKSFVGVLGLQLRGVLAIGKDKDLSPSKQVSYIRSCYLTVRRTLQVISFGLLSKMWDVQLTDQKSLSEEQTRHITDFFDSTFERKLPEQILLIKSLLHFFVDNSVVPHLTELSDFKDNLSDGSVFIESCQQLEDIYRKMEQADYSLLDCFHCEKHLTNILTTLSFLAAYKMISIKNITYSETRNSPAQYLHKFAALGLDMKSNENSERFRLAKEPIITDGILLYKENYSKSTNLFPFIIDFNSIREESGSQICFFNKRDISDDSLDYVSLCADASHNIAFADVLKEDKNLVDVMSVKEDRIKLRFDTVYTQFLAARKAILGAASKTNFSDFLKGAPDEF